MNSNIRHGNPTMTSGSEIPKTSYRTKKCLLIHDSVMDGFDQRMFSNEFDVTTYKTSTCYATCKDTKLKSTIHKMSPECIFVHVGMQDILNKRDTQVIMRHYEEFMWYLLEETKARICFSLIIPTKNSASYNRKIEEVNAALTIGGNNVKISILNVPRIFFSKI